MTTANDMKAGAEDLQGYVLLAVRFLLAPLYIYSGIGKILAFGVTASRLPGGEAGLGSLLAAGAIVLELGCSTALILGIWSRWASLLLIAFTIAATLMFHNFWASPAAQVQAQTINFLKNLGLIGALAMIAAFGPGPISLEDRWKRGT
jgi:putative oxidoreductase